MTVLDDTTDEWAQNWGRILRECIVSSRDLDLAVIDCKEAEETDGQA